MAGGLRSRSAMTRDISEMTNDLSTQLKQIQEQIHELVLDSRLSKQNREDQETILATIEPKLNSTITNPIYGTIQISNPLFSHYNHEQRHNTQKTPFKMEMLRFGGTDCLGGFSKSTIFFFQFL